MGGINKSLALLGGKPVLLWSLEAFGAHELVHEIILVAPRDQLSIYEALVARHALAKVRRIVAGGPERQESVHHGLRAVSRADVVVVHNGANPFVSRQEITAVVQAALEVGAAAVGVPSTST